MPQLPRTKLKLTFEQWPGIEVVAGSLSLDRALTLNEATPTEQLDGLAGVLITWNITNEFEQLIPCDRAGLGSLEIGQALAIFRAWLDAITDVPAPLARPSEDGLPWETAMIPTEAL
jgi:hypothetical protein